MESLINSLQALNGNQITYEEYVSIGREVAQYQLSTQETIPRERFDCVENALLSIWSNNEIFTQELFCECHDILHGKQSPESTSLPHPTVQDFRKARNAREVDELDEVIDEIFKVIHESFDEESEQTCSDELLDEAETIWENFLDGNPINTDDLYILQAAMSEL